MNWPLSISASRIACLERLERAVGFASEVVPVRVRNASAGEAGLQQEIGELVEQRLQIDRVRHLRAELRVGVEAHSSRDGGLGTRDELAPTRARAGERRWTRLDSLVAVYRNVLPGLGTRTTYTAPDGHSSPTTHAPSSQSINPFRVLLTHRNFRLFWIGQTLSLIGTWMQTMAQGWLALELTNNAFLVGLVASIGSLPILVLSLPAGVLADREHKLRLVCRCPAFRSGRPGVFDRGIGIAVGHRDLQHHGVAPGTTACDPQKSRRQLRCWRRNFRRSEIPGEARGGLEAIGPPSLILR